MHMCTSVPDWLFRRIRSYPSTCFKPQMLAQVRDAAMKKTKAAEEAREALEAERDALRGQIASLERDVGAAKQVRPRARAAFVQSGACTASRWRTSTSTLWCVAFFGWWCRGDGA